MKDFVLFEKINRDIIAPDVYLCRKQHFLSFYACKVISKDSFAKYKREGRFLYNIAKHLNSSSTFHPNILKFIKWASTEVSVFIVTEYCPGGSLRSVIETAGFLGETGLKYLALGIARGLYFLHSKRVAFTDLSPDNIFLTSNGTPKLADFGAAFFVREPYTMSQSSISFGSMTPKEIRSSHSKSRPTSAADKDSSADSYHTHPLSSPLLGCGSLVIPRDTSFPSYNPFIAPELTLCSRTPSATQSFDNVSIPGFASDMWSFGALLLYCSGWGEVMDGWEKPSMQLKGQKQRGEIVSEASTHSRFEVGSEDEMEEEMQRESHIAEDEEGSSVMVERMQQYEKWRQWKQSEWEQKLPAPQRSDNDIFLPSCLLSLQSSDSLSRVMDGWEKPSMQLKGQKQRGEIVSEASTHSRFEVGSEDEMEEEMQRESHIAEDEEGSSVMVERMQQYEKWRQWKQSEWEQKLPAPQRSDNDIFLPSCLLSLQSSDSLSSFLFDETDPLFSVSSSSPPLPSIPFRGLLHSLLSPTPSYRCTWYDIVQLADKFQGSEEKKTSESISKERLSSKTPHVWAHLEEAISDLTSGKDILHQYDRLMNDDRMRERMKKREERKSYISWKAQEEKERKIRERMKREFEEKEKEIEAQEKISSGLEKEEADASFGSIEELVDDFKDISRIQPKSPEIEKEIKAEKEHDAFFPEEKDSSGYLAIPKAQFSVTSPCILNPKDLSSFLLHLMCSRSALSFSASHSSLCPSLSFSAFPHFDHDTNLVVGRIGVKSLIKSNFRDVENIGNLVRKRIDGDMSKDSKKKNVTQSDRGSHFQPHKPLDVCNMSKKRRREYFQVLMCFLGQQQTLSEYSQIPFIPSRLSSTFKQLVVKHVLSIAFTGNASVCFDIVYVGLLDLIVKCALQSNVQATGLETEQILKISGIPYTPKYSKTPPKSDSLKRGNRGMLNACIYCVGIIGCISKKCSQILKEQISPNCQTSRTVQDPSTPRGGKNEYPVRSTSPFTPGIGSPFIVHTPASGAYPTSGRTSPYSEQARTRADSPILSIHGTPRPVPSIFHSQTMLVSNLFDLPCVMSHIFLISSALLTLCASTPSLLPSLSICAWTIGELASAICIGEVKETKFHPESETLCGLLIIDVIDEVERSCSWKSMKKKVIQTPQSKKIPIISTLLLSLVTRMFVQPSLSSFILEGIVRICVDVGAVCTLEGGNWSSVVSEGGGILSDHESKSSRELSSSKALTNIDHLYSSTFSLLTAYLCPLVLSNLKTVLAEMSNTAKKRASQNPQTNILLLSHTCLCLICSSPFSIPFIYLDFIVELCMSKESCIKDIGCLSYCLKLLLVAPECIGQQIVSQYEPFVSSLFSSSLHGKREALKPSLEQSSKALSFSPESLSILVQYCSPLISLLMFAIVISKFPSVAPSLFVALSEESLTKLHSMFSFEYPNECLTHCQKGKDSEKRKEKKKRDSGSLLSALSTRNEMERRKKPKLIGSSSKFEQKDIPSAQSITFSPYLLASFMYAAIYSTIPGVSSAVWALCDSISSILTRIISHPFSLLLSSSSAESPAHTNQPSPELLQLSLLAAHAMFSSSSDLTSLIMSKDMCKAICGGVAKISEIRQFSDFEKKHKTPEMRKTRKEAFSVEQCVSLILSVAKHTAGTGSVGILGETGGICACAIHSIGLVGEDQTERGIDDKVRLCEIIVSCLHSLLTQKYNYQLKPDDIPTFNEDSPGSLNKVSTNIPGVFMKHVSQRYLSTLYMKKHVKPDVRHFFESIFSPYIVPILCDHEAVASIGASICAIGLKILPDIIETFTSCGAITFFAHHASKQHPCTAASVEILQAAVECGLCWNGVFPAWKDVTGVSIKDVLKGVWEVCENIGGAISVKGLCRAVVDETIKSLEGRKQKTYTGDEYGESTMVGTASVEILQAAMECGLCWNGVFPAWKDVTGVSIKDVLKGVWEVCENIGGAISVKGLCRAVVDETIKSLEGRKQKTYTGDEYGESTMVGSGPMNLSMISVAIIDPEEYEDEEDEGSEADASEHVSKRKTSCSSLLRDALLECVLILVSIAADYRSIDVSEILDRASYALSTDQLRSFVKQKTRLETCVESLKKGQTDEVCGKNYTSVKSFIQKIISSLGVDASSMGNLAHFR
ncbi:hypothetical protein ADUPG1_008558 [Aduncisulcus paluster]|uniref:Protein kinase domain-containing protein n=1 Tax=Aduncisulcus paluster TaxID=2918883 RepID=A0ABQ5KTM3_9EUKA|nr:hypothetical protein ADUPG1_008558 [Aduncisulcus paluster]